MKSSKDCQRPYSSLQKQSPEVSKQFQLRNELIRKRLFVSESPFAITNKKQFPLVSKEMSRLKLLIRKEEEFIMVREREIQLLELKVKQLTEDVVTKIGLS